MKKTLYLLLIFTTVVFVSCSKLKNLGKVNFDVPLTQSVALPTIDSVNGIPFPTTSNSYTFPPIITATNATATFSQYNTNSSKVDSAILKSLSLQLSNGGNFNFVDTLRVYITDGQGLNPRLLAFQNGIPAGTTTLNLTPADVDLKSYLIQDSLGLQLQAHFIHYPPSNTNLNVSSKFTIYANLLN